MGSTRIIPPGFYVYTHALPDGTLFYIGKGSKRRAWSFARNSRSAAHLKIVAEHGQSNILIEVRECESEAAAFAMERQWIEDVRLLGIVLINKTSGGEGASGRPFSDKTRAALALYRGKAHFASISGQSKINMLEGFARGRAKFNDWRNSPEGREITSKNARHMQAVWRSLPPMVLKCVMCGRDFEAKSGIAKTCPGECRRARQRQRDSVA